MPDLRPYKTGPREEEGSESKDLYVKYTCDLSKSRRKFQKSGLESLFSITRAIKVGDQVGESLALARGGKVID